MNNINRKGVFMNVLVIDIGGSHIKFLVTGQTEPRRIDSGASFSPQQMVADVHEATKDWPFDVVSIGFPGPIEDNKPIREPKNIGTGWIGFDFAAALGKPVKLVNDAAMQAVGSYEGGRMLFLGLGTGLGSTLVLDSKTFVPMEIAHLPYRKGKTFEDHVGQRGLDHYGKKKWLKFVDDVVTRLRLAFVADYVVLGGGNARLIKKLPAETRLGKNTNAFQGGFRLWDEGSEVKAACDAGHCG
jgi:polyphosphate glucokinase